MIFIIISVISILSLLCDIYIYKQILAKQNIGITYKRLFILLLTIVYSFFIITFTFYIFSVSIDIKFTMISSMWAVYAMLLTLILKSVISIFHILNSFISYLINKNFKLFNYIGYTLALLIFIVFTYSSTLGRTQIVVNNIKMVSDKIPSSFNGYKIAFFSDLHIGTLINKSQMITSLTEKINNQNVDLILNGGDLVHLSHLELTPEILELLKKIKAPDGVYSVLGNHDLGYYYPDTENLPESLNLNSLTEKIESIDWKWVQDNSVFIHRGNDSISLTGHSFPNKFTGSGNYDKETVDFSGAYKSVNSTIFNITLLHDPRLWDIVLESNIGDLTLSGHIHAMQFKLKFGDKVISPAQFLYDRWSGKYEDGERMLYINDGLGSVAIPMRVWAKPELTIIELVASE